MSLDATERAIGGSTTKAIMAVHWAGRPMDMDRLNAIRRQAQAAGDRGRGTRARRQWAGDPIAGSHGNLTAYSFYVTKNITTIEGGAVATAGRGGERWPDRADGPARALGGGLAALLGPGLSCHYEVEEPGFKFNMTDVQAALGLHQLPRLEEWTHAERERLATTL